jgi:hypothetical protein
MESCLHCGSTTSSAGASNEFSEAFADRFIGLAVRSGDVKALHELASDQLANIGCFGHQTGSSPDGPSSLYKLRRMRIASKAMQAAMEMLTPKANDIHRFDAEGHLK